MLFSDMKKGQVVGVTFPDNEEILDHLRGKTYGFRVTGVRSEPVIESLGYGHDYLYVQNVKDPETGPRAFVGKSTERNWDLWKLVEPAVE